ncbi:MAG: hypothetical protein MUF53_12355 [Gemmatimonadaceae bacterium]|jgi:hypothetical protein|nr:hypothetical protein [Gemmatimonadaceae bacterium]
MSTTTPRGPRLAGRIAGVAMLALLSGCSSLTARFDETLDRQAGAQPPVDTTVLTEADLARLPAPVATYLRRAGAVGRPRVHNFVVEMDARLNQGPGKPWMETPVLQVSFVDRPARLFLLKTTMKGLPVTGLHVYADLAARMLIRVAGVYDVVDASGETFTRAETVTMLNDLCIMAPAALVDPRLTFTAVNDTSAQVTFVNGPHRVTATLVFDRTGDLADFWSDDRHALPDDGHRWSTPLRGYRDFGGMRLAGEGDATWHYADKPSWTYGRFVMRTIRYNVPIDDLPHANRLLAGR